MVSTIEKERYEKSCETTQLDFSAPTNWKDQYIGNHWSKLAANESNAVKPTSLLREQLQGARSCQVWFETWFQFDLNSELSQAETEVAQNA